MSMHPVTVCPPRAAHGARESQQFIAKSQRPVSAETHIDFGSYSRMQTITHQQTPHWRTGTPEWVLDKTRLREVIVEYCENRAFGKTFKPTGTLQERLKVAQDRLTANRP